MFANVLSLSYVQSYENYIQDTQANFTKLKDFHKRSSELNFKHRRRKLNKFVLKLIYLNGL